MKTRKVKLHQLEVRSFVTLLNTKGLNGGQTLGTILDPILDPVQEPGTLRMCTGSGSPC